MNAGAFKIGGLVKASLARNERGLSPLTFYSIFGEKNSSV
jgi:hypothetical protein